MKDNQRARQEHQQERAARRALSLKKFTPRQRAALAQLEEALLACAKAGLILFGMDRSIDAFDRKEMQRHGYPDKDLHQVRPDLTRATIVEDEGGAYEDSGGW